MASETTTAVDHGVETSNWMYGAIGGFVGSLAFGLMMQYVMPPPLLEVVIPAMYGIEGPALAAGWAIHQFHGVVLGLAYVAIVEFGGLGEYASDLGGSVALGIGYGIVTTIVLAVLTMPIWLSAVGFPNAPPFPNVAIPGTILSLVGHVAYGVLLAVVYAVSKS